MAAEPLDGEGLRRAAIGASGDARVRAMLDSADVSVDPAARWEASHGPVQGYAVAVVVCAEDLAALDASPATRDLLERAFALTVGASASRAMTSLSTRWNRRGVVHLGSYREVARTSAEVTPAEALRRYLASIDEGADVPVDLRVEETAAAVVVSTRAPLDRRARQPIEAALTSLLGPRAGVRWSVR